MKDEETIFVFPDKQSITVDPHGKRCEHCGAYPQLQQPRESISQSFFKNEPILLSSWSGAFLDIVCAILKLFYWQSLSKSILCLVKHFSYLSKKDKLEFEPIL